MSPTPPRSRTVKLGGLSDLESVKRTLQDQAQQTALLEAQRKLKAQRQQAEEQLFKRAIGAVKPLAHTPRVQLSAALPPPIPVQRQRDEASALQESLSDEMDVSSLLDTDSELSFRAPGVGPDVTRKLRRGVWSIQRAIDLHGLRSDEARSALSEFIREAHKQGVRCIRVVHGKGLGSPGKTPVLKQRVLSWLAQKQEVLAFVQARPAEGGAGALVVLLKPQLGAKFAPQGA
jgi:DNA-nicking Smr family endonuclease